MNLEREVALVKAELRSQIQENALKTEELFRSADKLRDAAHATRIMAMASAEVDVQLQDMWKRNFGT